MPKKILQKDSSVLRKFSEKVDIKEIKSSKIRSIIKEMFEALDSQPDGVALAAPQIGFNLRMFVVSKKVVEIIRKSKNLAKKSESEDHEKKLDIDLVFINPVLKKVSKETRFLEEGCLSVRYLYGKVKRSRQATIEAYDEDGKKFSRGATGLLAQIFQHEIDHLDGVLFVDKAKDIEEIPPEEIKNEKA